MRTRPASDLVPLAIVTISAVVGGAWHLLLGLRRAEGLTASAFDQAYFTQLTWNLWQGNGLRSSFNPGEFLGLHFSPLLALPAALQSLWTDARLLDLLQAVSIALATGAAFLFVRACLRPAAERAWIAAALSATIPVWAIVQQQARAGFHTEILALPLVLLAGWAGLTRRPAVMWLCAIGALMAKEDQVYPVAVMGLLIAAHGPGRLLERGRRQGILLVGASAAWAVVAFGIVMPAFRQGVTYDIDRYYAWLGGGLGILRAPFEQTAAFVAALMRPEGWLVPAGLVVSLALLPLLRPRWALLLLPPTVVQLLSRQEPQPQLLLQYGLLLLVPGLVAGALGARRALAYWWRRKRQDRAPAGVSWRSRTVAMLLLAAPAFLVAFNRGAVPPFSMREAGFYVRPAAREELLAATSALPSDALISVDWGLAPALAARPRLELLPDASPAAFVVVDRQPYVTGRLRWRDRQAWLTQLEGSGRTLLVDDGRFQVWAPLDE